MARSEVRSEWLGSVRSVPLNDSVLACDTFSKTIEPDNIKAKELTASEKMP